ncbi:hypothetical protein EV421DRAFT_1744466 [Armillaria borealis]|uniref:Uncharacterized protein n=1 Tax=Armillaria borealis TaxID=47425 RepID=A0AA39MDS1_9AGAR|nr:hypothetical protein EV421DRAFT_1744466 [Armillaria borealis]
MDVVPIQYPWSPAPDNEARQCCGVKPSQYCAQTIDSLADSVRESSEISNGEVETARSDGEHFEVLQGPRQIGVSPASNLRERYTLGTLSDATLTRNTLTFEDNNTVGSNATHTPALILVVLAGKKKQRARNLEAKSWPARNPARICSTHILLNSRSARRISRRNGLRANPAVPSDHSEAMADESSICGINGPLAHHFTIVAILPPCVTEVVLNTPSPFLLTLHDDENKPAKYGNFERCEQQEVGYRLCQKGKLLGLDVTTNNGADGVILRGFG